MPGTEGGAATGGGTGLPVTKDSLGMASRLAVLVAQIADGYTSCIACTAGDVREELIGMLDIAKGMAMAWIDTNTPPSKES